MKKCFKTSFLLVFLFVCLAVFSQEKIHWDVVGKIQDEGSNRSKVDDQSGLRTDLLSWTSQAQASLKPPLNRREKRSLETLTHTNEELRTACEESDFQRNCTHQEMMDYLEKVAAGSQDMFLSTYGQSVKGRELVYAVFSRPMVSNPFEAMASGKPIVVLDAGVHGNEKVLRESNLILIRELAQRGTEMNTLLDDLVVIMVPCLNPDGTEQNKRRNANGNDLNRDYIKLDVVESQAYVSNLLKKWNPHIQIGGHNSGTRYYNMLYLSPTNAAADPALTKICDEGIFPLIDNNLEAAGYTSFYYGNGNEERWKAGSYSPNIFRPYGGICNYISIVFESPRGQSLKDGTLSGIISYKSILEYCSKNNDEVMNVVNSAREKTIELGQKAEGEIAVQMEYVPEDYKVSYFLSDGIAGIPVVNGNPTAITLWAPLPDSDEELRADFWHVDDFDDDATDPVLSDGKMHFVALTTSANGSELWLIENSSANSLGSDESMIPGGDWTKAEINVGNGGALAEWADGFWEGKIGFVGVWNRVLSRSELGNVPQLDIAGSNSSGLSKDMLVQMTFNELKDPLGNELELFGDAELSNGTLLLDGGEGSYGEITGDFGEKIGIGQDMTIVLSIATETDQDHLEASPFGMGLPGVDPNEEASVAKLSTYISDADLLKKPVATKTRPRPYAYLLPHNAVKAIDLLKKHNITVEVLQKDTALAIVAYVLENIEHKERYNHPEATIITVADKTVEKVMTFPKGTYVVRTGQVMGRIISHMLEPETPENIIIWNTMDGFLPEPGPNALVPIYKLPKPTDLPIYSQTFTPGVPSFDSNGYVEYIPGNLPVIISVPHGGYLEPSSIPNRDCDNCVYIRDSYTQELARSMSEAFFEQMGGYAHIIINLLHRKKFDANRDIGDAADGNPIVEESWANYHQFIDSAKSKVIQNYGRGLFIDLHGHGHDIQRLELGYLLSRSELQLSDTELDLQTYVEQSSIQTLVGDNKYLFTHSELLHGPYSLGSLLSNMGVQAVPSMSNRHPYSSEPYFSGGYNTARHGSINQGNIDGIQIECHREVRFNNGYENFSVDLTKSINKFIDIHYDNEYLDNYSITGFSDDIVDEPLGVFPNPATNEINFKSNFNKFNILVYDCIGRQISSQNWNGSSIDIRFLKKGYYILKLRQDNGLLLGSQILIKN